MKNQNTILINGLPVREVSNGFISVDGTLLPFLLEELIARSASRIAIDIGSNASEFVRQLPQTLRSRATIVKGLKAFQRAEALLAPICEEFQYFYDDPGIVHKTILPGELDTAVSTLLLNLPTFLLGVEKKLQIDLDLRLLKRSIRLVRKTARNPEGRAVLATLQGILTTYEQQSIPGLVAGPTASSELIDLFLQLIENRTYLEMSKNAQCLGIPSLLSRALVLIKRGCKSVLSHKSFRQFLNLGSRTLEASVKVPIPDSDAADQLLGHGFLPPIISTRKTVKRAIKAWEKAYPNAPSIWWLTR